MNNRTLSGLSESALNRRGFLGLAALGVSAATLSACGGGPSTSAGPAAGKVKQVDFKGVKPAKEITFWTSNPGDSLKVTTDIINAFHASQSDVKVKLVSAGADYEEIAQKFQTAQTGGQLPDMVVLSDVWWFRYKINDQIIPLDSLVDTLGIQTDDFVDTLLNDYKYDGAQWALPWARSTPLFYYNKDHWKKAGLPDRAPSTWDEFNGWAAKLKAASGAKAAFQMPALAGYAGWTFQNNLWGYGGGWSKKDSFDLTANSKETVAALQSLKDMVYKTKVAGVASTDQIQDFGAGVASATVGSTGDLVAALTASKGKFELGAGFLPGGPKVDKPVCPTGGAGIGIPKGIDPSRQLAAGTFLKFLLSPENTAKFAQATGYMPMRKSADTSAIIKTTPQAKVAIDQLKVTRPQDWGRVFLPGGDIEMANSCAAILTQNKDVQTEMDALQAKLQKIYTQQVKPHVA